MSNARGEVLGPGKVYHPSGPAYTPELQPAEHPWPSVDEPIVNKHIPDLKTLEAIISQRCNYLANDRHTLKGRAGFNWWPPIANAS